MHRAPTTTRTAPGASALAAVALCAATLLAACAPQPPPGPAVRRTTAGSWGAGLAPTLADVAYGPAPEHRLDVRLSDVTPPRGTIVFVHGGGFTSGSRAELVGGVHGGIVQQVARGYDLVAVGYRTAPAARYPAARDDVVLALRWLDEHGAELGLRSSRRILVGHSAGGTIAAMIGTTPGSPTAAGAVPRVDRWVSVAGMSTLERRGMLEDFPAAWGVTDGATRRAASPITTLDRTDPPGWLVHGDLDGIVRDVHSTDLWARAVALGASVGYDRVDRGPRHCREHAPMCGADMDGLERFLDGRAGS